MVDVPKKRLGKFDYQWFSEEDLLREVPQPIKLTRLCLNWSQCKNEELIATPTTPATTTTTTTPATAESTPAPAFKLCGGCGVKYCCRECQIADWKAGHKKVCATLKLLRTSLPEFNKTQRRPIVQRIIHENRIYMCPFAVCKYNTQGRGFLFITSMVNSMNDFVYRRNVDMNGKRMDRKIELEYLDLGEYAELCKCCVACLF